MTLDDILASFVSLTGDAVSIGQCAPGAQSVQFVWVNDVFYEMFGYSAQELKTLPTHIVHDPKDIDNFETQLTQQLQEQRKRLQIETYCLHASGRRIWVSMWIIGIAADDGHYIVSIFRDLSALKEREIAADAALAERDRALKDSEATQTRLMEALNALPEPFSIWNPSGDLVIWNSTFADVVFQGQLRDDVDVTMGTIVKVVLERTKVEEGLLDANLDHERQIELATELVLKGGVGFDSTAADGRIFHTQSHRANNGDTMLISRDITRTRRQADRLKAYAGELKEAHAIANHQAYHDDLTGLPNRRYMAEALEHLAQRRAQEGGEIYALHLDLDGFKQVNDTKGHAMGDMMLKYVADTLRSSIDEGDICARTGGDEFIILLLQNDSNDRNPEDLAREIVDFLAQPVRLAETEMRVGSSVGISSTIVSTQESLLTDSDVALYKAKEWGRNRVEWLRAEDLAELERVKHRSEEILRALEHKEFIPYFQPQIDAATREVVGFEVLARWQHPERGVLLPYEFIDIAENLSVVEQIDQLIFHKALDLFEEFRPLGVAPSLAFNVSNRRLMSQSILEDSRRILDYFGPVSFELLETVFLDDPDTEFLMQINALTDNGIEIEIDDFGSGHASIIALEDIAPHRLKIDRRLVMPLTKSGRSVRLIRSIVEIGRALDIGIVAEGVETAEQIPILAEMGVELLQGYYFGRPMPFEQAKERVLALPKDHRGKTPGRRRIRTG
jgi:diguanylate cyclase (GGDEF)-like protein/PAS domain S-box-containing protein